MPPHNFGGEAPSGARPPGRTYPCRWPPRKPRCRAEPVGADLQSAGRRYVPYARRIPGRCLLPARRTHCLRDRRRDSGRCDVKGCHRMKIFTIGFTKKSAETFFTRLRNAEVKRLIDIRLKNVSQLAGFTKRDDLRYFTKTICNIDYVHLPELAPTADIDRKSVVEGKREDLG